jgi:hypothetical protein
MFVDRRLIHWLGGKPMQTRRMFIQIVPVAGVSLLVGQATLAQAMLEEKDPQAVALGYVSDAAKADKNKYKNYAAGQTCATCALYQGKESDASAKCALFAGKLVNGKGWCSAFAKKA